VSLIAVTLRQRSSVCVVAHRWKSVTIFFLFLLLYFLVFTRPCAFTLSVFLFFLLYSLLFCVSLAVASDSVFWLSLP
jgi:hypothetical protein